MTHNMFKNLVSLIIGLALLLPAAGLTANNLPEWQARAADALDLINEAGLANWRSNLPMLWSEPDSVRRLLAPKVREDKLQQAYLLLNEVKGQSSSDNRIFAALAAIEAYRGDRKALEDLTLENKDGRQDFRLDMLDYALYLRDWELAEGLVRQLEAEGVQPALTYRRAVLTGLTGDFRLADSLWREAVGEGLPISQAVYKELYKAGLGALVNPPALHSKVQGYLDALDFLKQRTASFSPALLPDGLRNGITAYEAGSYREAVQQWQTVSGPAELRPIIQCMIGEAQNRLGHYDEAIRLWDEITKTNPGLFLGYLGLAEAYRGKGQKQKAENCLQLGFRRTDSLFLLNNNTIGPNVLREIRGDVRKGTIAGYNLVSISAEDTKGADGFWISWNYGRDWLWYPNYLHPFALPSGSEYWIKATGTLLGSNFREMALREKTPIKPEIKTPLVIENTDFGEVPSVRWEWSAPVALQFEYWTPGGARMTVENTSQTLHLLELENVEPGREYRYRAFVTKDGQEVAVVEGTFTTGTAPFWGGIGKPVILAKRGQVYLDMTADILTASYRWAENNGSWSDWTPVKSRLILDLSAGQGTKELRIQFKDIQGSQSPVLHETVNLDNTPPRIMDIQRKKNSDGGILAWRTDEPSLGYVWYLTGEKQWKILNDESVYTRHHSLTLPAEAVQFGIWSEDRAGNVGSGPNNLTGELKPISFRINGGEESAAERNVLLSLNWTGEKNGTAQVRFSNDGVVWGSWKPLQEAFLWRLTGGSGKKNVFAQIREDSIFYLLQSVIRLEQTKIDISHFEFVPLNNNQCQASWNTSVPARCRLFWGSAPGDMHLVEEDDYSLDHRAKIEIVANKRYLWRLEAQDQAGNRIVWTDGWFIGNSLQKVPVVGWESSRSVKGSQNLKLNFQANGSSPTAMRLRNRGGAWTGWIPFQPSLSWRLLPGLDRQYVEAQFKEETGFISPIYAVPFSQDLRPARVYGAEIRTGADGVDFIWKSDKKVKGWLLVQIQSSGAFKDYASFPGPVWAFEGTVGVGKLPRGVYRMRLLVQDAVGNWNGSNWVTCEVE